MSLVYSYSFLPAAEKEYIDVIKWYQEISTGLAYNFIFDFDNCIDVICNRPKSFPVFFKNYRKLNFTIYPYKIIYRVEKNQVIVVAVAHHKRHPRYWRRRK